MIDSNIIAWRHHPSIADKDYILLVDAPHAGLLWPDDVHVIPYYIRQKNADTYTDILANNLYDVGFNVMFSHISRMALDLNRSITDVKPYYFKDVAPYCAPAYAMHDIGLITPLYKNNRPFIDYATYIRRLQYIYYPYYHGLRYYRQQANASGKMLLHCNIHSYPSHLAPHYDIVLGNDHHKSTPLSSLQQLGHLYSMAGYKVGYNVPFSGGHIIRQYRDIEAPNNHAIQIEVNRALYMSNHRLDDKNMAILCTNMRHIMHNYIKQLSPIYDYAAQ